ncbi:MAG: putative porin, partial [Endomicrobiaceae bacterium]|nr:putative porin [Endomicrobiaceae bacterium]
MLKRNLFLAAAVVATMSCSAFADFSSLANLLAEKGIISYGEAQTLSTESKEEAKMKLASGKSELVPLWVQNMTFKGDVRIRTQYDWDASNQARLRERLRLRMGIETRPVEKIKLGFGLATGSLSSSTGKDADPSSTNHTFEYMNKSPLFVDYAYIQYDPSEWLVVRGGKVKGKT